MMQRGVQAAERAFASLRPVGNARKLPPLTPDDHHIIALRGKRPRDMIDQRDAAEQGRALVRTEAPRRATRDDRAEQLHADVRGLFLNRRARAVLED
jgi:hypothetical protein